MRAKCGFLIRPAARIAARARQQHQANPRQKRSSSQGRRSAKAQSLRLHRVQHDPRGGSDDPHPSAGSAPLGGIRTVQSGVRPPRGAPLSRFVECGFAIRPADFGACATAASSQSAAEVKLLAKTADAPRKPKASVFIAYNTILAADRMIRTPPRQKRSSSQGRRSAKAQSLRLHRG